MHFKEIREAIKQQKPERTWKAWPANHLAENLQKKALILSNKDVAINFNNKILIELVLIYLEEAFSSMWTKEPYL